jgi:16S rRNA (adenine1518-N6/adenine1519-N6)-dimethyltransferase
VQKEVGERILAKPETKDYGMLSLIAQFYAGVKKIRKIPPTCFYPRPAVDSMVIRFCKKHINYSEEFTDRLFEVISAAFKNRRKTIFNSLVLNLRINTDPDTDLKNLLKEVFSRCNIQTNERAEDISLDRYIRLTESLRKILK